MTPIPELPARGQWRAQCVHLGFLSLALVSVGVAACHRKASSVSDAGLDADAIDGGNELASADGGSAVVAQALSDDGASSAQRAGDPESYHAEKTFVTFAAIARTSVMSERRWPESDKSSSVRLGYVRAGATIRADQAAVVNDDCTDGWHELEDGGFVCGKAITADLTKPAVRRAPKGPDLDAGVPYRYGVNLSDDTPVYRRVLSAVDREKYEPWLGPSPRALSHEPGLARKKRKGASAAASTPALSTSTAYGPGAAAAAGSSAASAPSSAASEETGEGAAAADDVAAPALPPPTPPVPPNASSTGDAKAKAQANANANAEPDAARPTLKELRGRGVLVRKMARGFVVALDKDFRAAGARWWRTSLGFAVPFERLMVKPEATTYHGSWFESARPPVALPASPDGGVDADASTDASVDADAGTDASARTSLGAAALATAPDGGALADAMTVGFVQHGYAHQLQIDAKRTQVKWGPALPKRSAVRLTGDSTVIAGQRFYEASGGFWVRLSDLTLARPRIPADVGPDEKWIDVDLTRQALVAFEGTQPVFATLISSGRRNLQDKATDFPTPSGTFYIREKHVTATMDGDVASYGPYSIEEVPWVMYFQGSYALHGAFWHDQFGRQKSHGCVNMAPDDARRVFAWSNPPLPAGWHGVMATAKNPGTRVVVHDDAGR